jgi:hypothetical protein
MTGDHVMVTPASARRSLDSACEDLDNAVRALPGIDDDDVMASPGLVALLLRVVVASRQLAGSASFVIGVSRTSPDGTRWV